MKRKVRALAGGLLGFIVFSISVNIFDSIFFSLSIYGIVPFICIYLGASFLGCFVAKRFNRTSIILCGIFSMIMPFIALLIEFPISSLNLMYVAEIFIIAIPALITFIRTGR